MANPVFDAKSTSQNFNAATSVTLAHTCGAGATSLFVLVPYWSTGVADGQLTGVTYNGVAMTLVDKENNGSAQDKAEIYVLASPATGAHNIVATFQSANNGGGSVYGVSFTNTPTSGGLGTLWADPTNKSNNPTVANSTLTVPNNTSNDAIIDCICTSGGQPTMTAATNRTLGANGVANGNGEGWSYLTPGPTGNQVMAWTFASATSIQLAVRVLGTGAAAAPIPERALTVLQAVNRASTY